MKVSEVKPGTQITISLDEASYPCSPDNLQFATSKITGTLFRGGSTPVIAWKTEEKAPIRSWDIASKPRIDTYAIPAGFNRGYYLAYPDLEVEVEAVRPAKTNDHLGFMLACIGAGTLITSLSQISVPPTTATKRLSERIEQ